MLNSLSVWDSSISYIHGRFSTSDGLSYTVTLLKPRR